jgi:hypothetical protein
MRLVLPAAGIVAAAGLALSVYGIMAPPYVHPPEPPSSPGPVATARPAELAPSLTATDPTPTGPVGSAPIPTRPGLMANQIHPRRAVVATPPLKRVPTQRSAPVKITLATIGVSSPLGPARGLKPNGSVADAPLSGPLWSLPWWYKAGPAPGQPGSAVILGHVDSALGAGHLGVFFKIGDLRPGEQITVTLADGRRTQWVITSAHLYDNGSFPNATVYARTGPPTLRLVTCGGDFDWQTHLYDSATVVTARPAPTA